MITIALQQDEQQHYSGFCISGHAESADEGYDLVCAAVSVLAQTAFLGCVITGRNRHTNSGKDIFPYTLPNGTKRRRSSWKRWFLV
jgi:uncharacterized protein YsxB (DUF464 family)